ncbi:DUF4282 domain-containing protein [Brucella pseudogrignonensis]|uniref:DUF4282 domain-containing protein n=1 Tax=Brucella pseudogrignonensis TaxID=419475 RepID=UPI0028B8FF73|nr:DUF4282 domain-containing protein [Brucella pseudogrignonensis]MDT6940232.1 DUF4282 domain-containing protein [Brucella pseudogrignonensis]
MKNLFHFDNLMTPSIVKFIYWLGLLILMLAALIALMMTHTPYGDVLTILGVIFAWLLSCLLWRVVCEIIILQFNIFSRLTEIRDRLPATSKEAG